MAKKSERNIITGLDIGTSKIVALVGEVALTGEVELIGIGQHPSLGLKRGVVVDIELTVQAIQRAVQEAELMAGCDVASVYAGIAGSHIHSMNSHGIVAIRDNEVTAADVDRVLEAARAVAIPADQKILHVLPQEYIIDGQDGIREPIGMAGVRLEARVHIVSGSVSAAQNIEKCIMRCGLKVNDIILEQLASSYAVLTDDEKELGVCLVDIGDGTTDIAIFHAGAIQYTAVIPVAGYQVTNDIAMAFRTSSKIAETVKKTYGLASADLANGSKMIDIDSGSETLAKKVSVKNLADVISARYEEIFSYVRDEIMRSGFADLIGAGVVLTGGGSEIKGAVELAEMSFELPVRIGVAKHIKGLDGKISSPALATSVGLLLNGHQQQQTPNFISQLTGDSSGMWIKMKKWFKGNF